MPIDWSAKGRKEKSSSNTQRQSGVFLIGINGSLLCEATTLGPWVKEEFMYFEKSCTNIYKDSDIIMK